MGRPIDSDAKTSCMVLSQNYFVTSGILPNFNSINRNQGTVFGVGFARS